MTLPLTLNKSYIFSFYQMCLYGPAALCGILHVYAVLRVLILFDSLKLHFLRACLLKAPIVS